MRQIGLFMFRNVLFAFCIGILFLNACSSRRSQPMRGALAMDDPAVKNGQIHFMRHCQKCHPAGEAGLGPAINSNPAPGFLKRFQVRHGLGVMPAFKANEIPKKELDEIMIYLKMLRKNR